jgi:hypothetical protein
MKRHSILKRSDCSVDSCTMSLLTLVDQNFETVRTVALNKIIRRFNAAKTQLARAQNSSAKNRACQLLDTVHADARWLERNSLD